MIKNNNQNRDDELMTIPEVANYLRVTRQCVYNYINTGKLKALEVKGARTNTSFKRIRKSDIDSLFVAPEEESNNND